MMHGNILDYVEWRGDITFEQSPFNDVDALIFAQLSYNKLEGLISSDFDSSVTLAQADKIFNNAPDIKERKNLGYLINPETVTLLTNCAKSKRYGNVKLSAFTSIFNKENSEQFAAVTFTYDKISVVTLRGTDDHIIGWKEDFNISYMNPIPAQKDALEYFNKAAAAFPKNKLYVTGHSKGGNLSLYAGTYTTNKNKKRLLGIYNLDGPGFSKEFFKTKEFESVRNRVVSVYPELDIVGMFFKHDSNYQIIKSTEKGIRQHDSFSWEIIGTHFVKALKFAKESQFFEKSFNEWADNLTLEDKKKFTDALFDIFLATDYDNVLDISENVINSSKKMFSAYIKMDSEAKANIKRIIDDLGKAIQQEIPVFNFMFPQK